MRSRWPHLDDLLWRETCSALRLYLKTAGRSRAAPGPCLAPSLTTTIYVTPSGLASTPILGCPGVAVPRHPAERTVVETRSHGHRTSIDLAPPLVAASRADFVRPLADLAGTPACDEVPNAACRPLPFEARCERPRARPHVRVAAQRDRHALMAADKVFNPFRTSYFGEFGPTDPFWEALGHAMARVSGRRDD